MRGGFGEEFYSNGSRARLLIRIRVCAGPAFLYSGLRWSSDELLWFSRLSNCDLLSEMKNPSSSSLRLPFVGGFGSTEELKDSYMYPSRWNQDPAPRLHYCFLTAPPLSLHPLPSLISNSLNLPFGTQRMSWRLKSILYKQKMGDTESFPCPGAPEGPTQFHRCHH